MRLCIFDSMIEMGSKLFTATVVICFIAHDIASETAENLRQRWEVYTGKQPKCPEDQLSENEESNQTRNERLKDLPGRSGSCCPAP